MRKSHVYFTAEFIGIKRMSGLTQLEHHKIRNIHNVVNGANAYALDFSAQPIGLGPTPTFSIRRAE